MATEGATTFEYSSGSVAYSAMWTGNALLLDPATDLAPNVRYWVNVSSAAKDRSDPGNALSGAPYSLSFVTTSGGDTTPPVAEAGGPYQATLGVPITLDGSRSTDGIGIVNWTWTVEVDGLTITVYGPTPTYSFAVEGDFNATLVVRDGAGNVAIDTAQVQVRPPSGNGGTSSPVWLWGVLIAVVVVLAIVLFILFRRRKRKNQQTGSGSQ